MISKYSASLTTFFAIALSLCLFSCSPTLSESEFDTAVGTNIQHYLDITSLDGLPIKLNTVINLNIKNKTGDCVVFPYNFGVKMFVYQNHSWIDIPDNGIDVTHKDVVLDPRGGLFPDTVVILQPDFSKLEDMSIKHKMRIVMIGRLCKKGLPSSQNTADYIEVQVEP